MTTKKGITTESLNEFLLKELETTQQEIKEVQVMKFLMGKYASMFEVPAREDDELILVAVTPAEHEILIQSLGARKKLLRGRIRNNQRKIESDDFAKVSETGCTEKDYKAAIKRRKVQLADTDMLKTRLENL